MRALPKLPVNDFNLEHTLSCGQLFRTWQKDGWHCVISRNRFFRVRQLSGLLEYQGVSRKFLEHYFALDEPYTSILSQINKDPYIGKAIEEFYGMRILRQDPWECLISFLCSSAANIPKIKLNLESLSLFFGEKIEQKGFIWHSFPRPGDMCNYKQIALAKTGFRAKYLKAANDAVNEAFLRSLKKLPYREAKHALKQLPGVGDKIADCVLLFSLDFPEAFPIDTWMKKILQKLYFKNKAVPNPELCNFGMDYFGRYAGYAQQFLYMFARKDSTGNKQRTVYSRAAR
jgi:N-glycosylase/DNA lyase